MRKAVVPDNLSNFGIAEAMTLNYLFSLVPVYLNVEKVRRQSLNSHSLTKRTPHNEGTALAQRRF